MTYGRISTWKQGVLLITLILYLLGRISQLFADRLPTLAIVLLHVVPPAIFALTHAAMVYRRKGMLTFALACLTVGGLSEGLGLRTGYPFGHYQFTDVMGPKFFGLPYLLVLAYLGIGYCSWVLSISILRLREKALRGVGIVTVPALAGFIMLVWDISMEADWSTVDKAWIWRDGGPYFGVPVSNFCGWYLTAFAFYTIFALYCSRHDPAPVPNRYWRMAIAMYAICAVGNILVVKLPMAPPVVADATGHLWSTGRILLNTSLVSVGLMLPFSFAAWARTGNFKAVRPSA